MVSLIALIPRDLVRLYRPYLSVGHPAAGLDLVAVEAPVLELLLEQGPAHVRRVVQLPRPGVWILALICHI